jgi:hypothetical protein
MALISCTLESVASSRHSDRLLSQKPANESIPSPGQVGDFNCRKILHKDSRGVSVQLRSGVFPGEDASLDISLGKSGASFEGKTSAMSVSRPKLRNHIPPRLISRRDGYQR